MHQICQEWGITLLQVCCDLFSPAQALCQLSLALGPMGATWLPGQCMWTGWRCAVLLLPKGVERLSRLQFQSALPHTSPGSLQGVQALTPSGILLSAPQPSDQTFLLQKYCSVKVFCMSLWVGLIADKRLESLKHCFYIPLLSSQWWFC